MTTQGLTLQEILAAQDVTIEAVQVPEWGGTVYVRSVSGNKRDAVESEYTNGRSLIGIRGRWVGACLCDSEGKFLDPSENEIEALGKKSAAALDRLFGVCQRINGMRASDAEDAEGN